MISRISLSIRRMIEGWRLHRRHRQGTIAKKLIGKYIPAGAVIVEAGAHVGFDTLEMSGLWPDAHIHAFEPIPVIFEQLKANVGSKPNITCYPLALGSTNGRAPMFVSSGASDGSSSLLQPQAHLVDHPEVKFESAIEVQTMTLDDWALTNRIPSVDLLWLDMQGFELSALAAATATLRHVRAIHTEINLKPTYKEASLYPELRSWLEARGFKVKQEAIPWPDGGNVLFVRNS